MNFADLYNKLAFRFAPMTEAHIQEQAGDIHWDALSHNRNFLWNQAFIDAHIQELDLWALSSNPSVPRTVSMFEAIPWQLAEFSRNTGFPWSIDFINKYADILHWKSLSQNSAIRWSPMMLDQVKERIHFWSLSQNTGLNWSIEFIEQYQDKLSWAMLSENPALPWRDIHFIYRFSNNFVTTALYANPSYPIRLKATSRDLSAGLWESISTNQGINFDIDILEEYADKWCWASLSRNPAVPWSQEVIRIFNDQIDWLALAENTNAEWDEEYIFKIIELGGCDLLAENIGVWNYLRRGLMSQRMIAIER